MLDHRLLSIIEKHPRVPRYTSYPTAPHFQANITQHTYEHWLASIAPDDDISLYIHIPFCKQLCWFCGCHTKVVNHYEPIARYLETLKQEMTLVASKLHRQRVTHIHFGGGSPTLIKADDFSALMAHLGTIFTLADTCETAIEIDPRTISEGKIAAYAKSGVNRASIGIQDFNAQVQESINRLQSFSTVYETVATLRDYGISNINADLIYGLPHQNIESIVHTTELTVTLKPERIALFGYAHVPWMKKHQQLINESALPNREERLTMLDASRKALIKNDYRCIGLDHFVLKNGDLDTAQQSNTLHRNFQGYTTDTANTLIGLGVSSISALPQGYIQNAASSITYAQTVNAQKLPISKGIELSDDDRIRRDIINTLMCQLTVDLKQYNGTFTEELAQLQILAQNGIIELHDSTIIVPDTMRDALRVVASLFDSYLIRDEQKHSSAV